MGELGEGVGLQRRVAAVAVVVEVADVAGGAAALPVLAEDVEGGGLRPGGEDRGRACPREGRRRPRGARLRGSRRCWRRRRGRRRPAIGAGTGAGGGAGGVAARAARRGAEGGVGGEGREERVGGDGGEVGEARGRGGGEVVERGLGRILDHRHRGAGGVEAGDPRVGGEVAVEEGGGAGDVARPRPPPRRGGCRRSTAGMAKRSAAAGSGVGGPVRARLRRRPRERPGGRGGFRRGGSPGARGSRGQDGRRQDAGTRRGPSLSSGGAVLRPSHGRIIDRSRGR